MKVGPLFSVVIANYNYGRFLEEAIQSVISQNMGDQVELIICDAESTDNSVEIIKKYACGLPPNTSRGEWAGTSKPQTSNSELISWWCSENDGGQSSAFNKGFSHARGKFLTWLNADDILTNGALEAVRLVSERHPNCRWIAGSSLYADEKLRVLKCFCAHSFSSLRARWGFLSVWGPSSFFTKELLMSAGGVDENLHYLMDIDLWHRFYACGAKYCVTLNNIFAYRRHEASKMSGASVKSSDKGNENRRRAKEEESAVNLKYGIREDCWKYKAAWFMSFSIIDAIIAFIRTCRWRGVDAKKL